MQERKFSHDEHNMAEKNSTKFNQNLTQKFIHEKKIVKEYIKKKESMKEQGSSLQQVLIELLNLLVRESNIQTVKAVKPWKRKSYKVLIGLFPRDCYSPSSVKMESAFIAKECGVQPGAGYMWLIYSYYDKCAVTHHSSL